MTSLGARPAPRTRGHEPRVEALIASYRRTGDRRLRDRAVRESLPLARRLALRFHNGREPLEDDERLARVEDRVAVAARLATLPERERRVVRLRFVHDLTQSEIARRMGCSQMQISRLLRRAIAAMAGG